VRIAGVHTRAVLATRGDHRVVRAPETASHEMPTVVDPMMAVLAKDIPGAEDRYGFEFKWDGIRAVAFSDGRGLRLQTRNRKDATGRHPELQLISEALDRRRAVLDGEVVALDELGRPSFEQLQQRMGLTADADVRRLMQAVPVAYMIFDLIYLDDALLVGEPYTQRRERLEGLQLSGQNWQTPPYEPAHGPAMLRASRESGLEGVIAKRLDSPYEPGRRSGAWLKVKNRLRQELVVAGWVEGEGRRKGLPGALLVGYYEGGRLVYAGKVGTGFSESMLAKLAPVLRSMERADTPFGDGRPPSDANFVEPRLVAEVEFSEWTRAGDLRAPSFKGLREDKDPREVVREIPSAPGAV
jgi:bifunctional non-homologous end joining protein LigD